MKTEISHYLDTHPDILNKMGNSIYIVYIRSGGKLVSSFLEEYLIKNGVKVESAGITCKRSLTTIKQKPGLFSIVFKKIINLSPYIVLNILRNIEHFILNKMSKIRNISDCSINWTYLNNSKYVLIVDDAIDSGYSLSYVHKYISDRSLKLEIDSFSVVVTRKLPVKSPTYSIFNNVLIRFPWSMDFKK